LRTFLVAFRPQVLPGPEIHLADCMNQFDENGHLTSEIYQRDLTALMQNLAAAIERGA
jgi:chromate reductase